MPLHRNPMVRNVFKEVIGKHAQAVLCEPLDYDALVAAIQNSYLILTDSGGIQEEAPAFGKQVLVLRTTTERPEAIEAGTSKLIGIKSNNIFREANRLLSDEVQYQKIAQASNPFRDGKASKRITLACNDFINKSKI